MASRRTNLCLKTSLATVTLHSTFDVSYFAGAIDGSKKRLWYLQEKIIESVRKLNQNMIVLNYEKNRCYNIYKKQRLSLF